MFGEDTFFSDLIKACGRQLHNISVELGLKKRLHDEFVLVETFHLGPYEQKQTRLDVKRAGRIYACVVFFIMNERDDPMLSLHLLRPHQRSDMWTRTRESLSGVYLPVDEEVLLLKVEETFKCCLKKRRNTSCLR